MKKREVAIELRNVVKEYTIHHEKPTLSDQILYRGSRRKFKALNDVSIKIYKGEKVGILGKNGSGKTTLLKLISGISTPNSGAIITHGKVVSLINLSAGFHGDLTGEENIMLNGLLLGMTKQELKSKMNEIISFADIGEFIDAPFYTYSEGMKLRLGFAIAVYADPDILILDEGTIAAGDANFQKKLSKKIDGFFKKKKTILLVTHWQEFLEKNCNRLVLMQSGRIAGDGAVKNIFKLYDN